YYFARPLARLSKDELALLVGMVKGPSWYDPRRNPERALERRNLVLSLMAEQQVISEAQLQSFRNRPLKLATRPVASSNRFPAFIDLVKRQLQSDYDEDDPKSEGLRIFTTLDPLVQQAAEHSIKLLDRLEQQYPQTQELQAAIVVAAPENGEIQALVGDRVPEYPGFNRALDASRQIGSLIKPVIYLSALQQPKRYHLASLLDDSVLRLKARNGDIWEPKNYDKEFIGDITLYHALIHSRNIPAVRVGLDIGLAEIVRTLHNLGITRDVPPYPSITLGAFSLTPFDVATMYQGLAAKGFITPLRAIRDVTDAKGNILNRYPLKLEQTISAQTAYLLNHALHGVTQEGTAKSLKQQLDISVAGKTGTTDDLRDSWFAGFSDDRLAVVWIGRDDNQSTGLTGSTGALQLWTDLMRRIPIRDLQLDMPEGIETKWIDPVSGRLSEKHCSGALELPFISGSGPSERAECSSPSLFQRLRNLFD
ncbi:MAG: penicillin-binding protein 1B, partial [Gammaproteobacteria bacterium]